MKKGQATVFVILGIIILASAILAISYKDLIIKKMAENQLISTTVLPAQAREVNDLVTGCIGDIAEYAITLLGVQGGYINIPRDNLAISPSNPFSNKLSIFPNTDLEVAYWFYLSPNNLQVEQVPSISTMEKELSSFMDKNLVACANKFSQFENYMVSFSDPVTTTKINEDTVSIEVTFPVRVEFENTAFEFSKFNHNVQTKLGRLYSIALEIFNKENKDLFLEEKTLDFLVVYDELPFSGVDFECTPKTWSKIGVINRLKEVLNQNLAFLKIKGTNYFTNEKYYEIDALTKTAGNVNVNFMYAGDWPILIDINPSKGDILAGDSFTTNNALSRFLFSLFCLNSYHFVYDIQYPVLITLSDENYIFQFATQVVIDNNQPRVNSLTTSSNYDTSQFICSNKLTDLTVFALEINEDETLSPVSNAEIYFKCLGTTCSIGNTGKEFLKEKFPQCLNAEIVAKKEGLQEGKTIVTTNEESTISIIMEPIYEMNYNIKLIDKNGLVRDVNPNERVNLQFENSGQDYSTSVFYPRDKRIRLVVGDYNVRVFVSIANEGGIRLNEDTVQTCIDVPKAGIFGFIGMKEKRCVENKVDALTLDQVLVGGAEFRWRVLRKDLANSNKVTFYVKREDVPRNVGELGLIHQKIVENSKDERLRLPTFE